jgi:hypothetical protein
MRHFIRAVKPSQAKAIAIRYVTRYRADAHSSALLQREESVAMAVTGVAAAAAAPPYIRRTMLILYSTMVSDYPSNSDHPIYP